MCGFLWKQNCVLMANVLVGIRYIYVWVYACISTVIWKLVLNGIYNIHNIIEDTYMAS